MVRYQGWICILFAIQSVSRHRHEHHRRAEFMTSDKQIDANRKNALKSTGPKTPEGKDAIRLNALKHGLLSKEILLPGEDEEALMELGERLRHELQPVGELENLLVERIVASYWRLRRLGRVEAGIFAWELYGEFARRADRGANNHTKPEGPIIEYEVVFLDDSTPPGIVGGEVVGNLEKDQEARHKAQEIEAKRDAETPTLGRAFIRD